MFQNLGEEIWKGRKARRQAAGRGDGKGEDHERRETLLTGGYRETSLGYETGLRGDGRPPLKEPRREDKAFLGGKEENEGEGTCRDNTFGEKEDRVLSF